MDIFYFTFLLPRYMLYIEALNWNREQISLFLKSICCTYLYLVTNIFVQDSSTSDDDDDDLISAFHLPKIIHKNTTLNLINQNGEHYKHINHIVAVVYHVSDIKLVTKSQVPSTCTFKCEVNSKLYLSSISLRGSWQTDVPVWGLSLHLFIFAYTARKLA